MPVSGRIEPDLEQLFSSDRMQQGEAFHRVIAATDDQVDWAYAVWDRVVAGLSSRDNRIRSVSAQLLCNLAKSDPDRRILRDFDALLEVTRDPRFVTARHCLQNIWKVGVAGGERLERLLEGLRTRYDESAAEKNGTLIRYDIQLGLARLYAALGQDSLRTTALAWIEKEPDPKYQKKLRTVWR